MASGPTKVIDNVHMISKGGVNAYLLSGPDGLTLIDTGGPGTADMILRAVKQLGNSPSELTTIILTHAHPDHIGSAAALARATGAVVLIHALDKDIAEKGRGFRPMKASPGLLLGLLFKLFAPKPNTSVEPVHIDQVVAEGALLAVAGGLDIVHVPGHCAGQVAVIWQRHKILFAADACANMFGLGDPIGCEDLEIARDSQRKLAALSFDIACFGHGRPVIRNASARFRAKWKLRQR